MYDKLLLWRRAHGRTNKGIDTRSHPTYRSVAFMKTTLSSNVKTLKGWKAFLIAASVFALSSAARAQVQFDGDVRFGMSWSRLSVYMEEIENLGDVSTERLRIRVWASEHRWTEWNRGHLLGSATIPRIAAHRDRDHLHRSMKLRRPDTDWYYVTIVLEERVVDANGNVTWEIRDWSETDDQVFIRDTWFPLFPWD